MPQDESNQPTTRADLDRAVELILREISTTREDTNHRLEGVERRLERVEINTTGMLTQLSALNKSMTDLDKAHIATQAAQTGQQRVIDDILRRLDALERKAS